MTEHDAAGASTIRLATSATPNATMNHAPSSDDDATRTPPTRERSDVRESRTTNPAAKPAPVPARPETNPNASKGATGAGAKNQPGGQKGGKPSGPESKPGRAKANLDDDDAVPEPDSEGVAREASVVEDAEDVDQDEPAGKPRASDDEQRAKGEQRQRNRGQGASPAKPREGSSGQQQKQAPGRPGEGKKTDRNGKTYEGKTGVSGETGGTDEES